MGDAVLRPFIERFAVVTAMVIAMVFVGTMALAANNEKKSVAKAASVKKVAIAVIGDSMARSYCRGLTHFARSIKSVEILCWTKPSTGLTRDDYYDWEDALLGRLKKRTPDAAIVSMGANDAQRLVYKKKILEFAAADWTEVYSSRVEKFIKTLNAKGSRVFWVGMPIARSARYTKRMRHLNKIYSTNVEGNAQTFLSLWKLTQDKNGRFTRSMRDPKGRMRIARATDGIHFTKDGELIVACYLFNSVLPQMGIQEQPKGCRSKKK